jgi:hypothetical protein
VLDAVILRSPEVVSPLVDMVTGASAIAAGTLKLTLEAKAWLLAHTSRAGISNDTASSLRSVTPPAGNTSTVALAVYVSGGRLFHTAATATRGIIRISNQYRRIDATRSLSSTAVLRSSLANPPSDSCPLSLQEPGGDWLE